MSTDLYFSFYPKECTDPKILPFINPRVNDLELNGKFLSREFYELCKHYAVHDTENNCYIFDVAKDATSFYEFMTHSSVPELISDYVSDPGEYQSKFKDGRTGDEVFIIWVR